MTQEEIILKMGLDGTALNQGLRTGKEKVREFAAETKAKFTETLSAVGIGLGIGALVEGLKRLADEAHRIKTEAESLGTSTTFTQFLSNAGRLAGESGEAVEAMVAKWEKSLPVGTDVEEAFEGVMKRLVEMKDPAERMALAFDLFGKKGETALKMAQQWKEAKGIPVMSETQLKLLEMGSRSMDDATQQLKVFGASVVQMIADTAAAFALSHENRRGVTSNLKDIITARANQGRADNATTKANRARWGKMAQDRSDAEAQEAYVQKLGDVTLQNGSPEEKLGVLRGRLNDIAKAMDSVRKGSKEWWENLAKGRELQEQIYGITTKQADETKKAAEEKRKEHEALTDQLEKVETKIDKAQHEEQRGLEPTEKELIGSGAWVDTGRMVGSRQHGRRFVQSAGGMAASEIAQRENIIKAANSGFYSTDKKTNEGIVKEQEDAISRVRKWMGEHGIHTQEQDQVKDIAAHIKLLIEEKATIKVKLAVTK